MGLFVPFVVMLLIYEAIEAYVGPVHDFFDYLLTAVPILVAVILTFAAKR
ncbi:MAG: hypothetical protein AAGA74_16580 [Pseudomonadota bacterium]